ncbi:endonuclease/exonuclease/phosphatase family protein [Microbacterium sp.]|uniref:endonuclease/exonuclease/phosphatase family protein n=1 Tax=Microbacterium sp. TaxID=51671 RepID=UPI0025D8487A|nr:endonuclease/exonuclease/phosphatase family protein [Microbacterium sp.]MBT9604996.1 endonuclease/exonuclease/phosphatase family protein [Microbacterium sp.]
MPPARRRRLALLVTLAVGAVVAVPLVWPQVIGAQRWLAVALPISFRAPLALGLLALALLAAVVALARRRLAIAAGVAMVLAVAALGNGLVLLARGGGGPVGEGDLTVAAWNTYGGGASPESIARFIRETGADVVSLPETDARAAAAVVGILARDGIAMTADTVTADPGDDPIPTSILISDALGPYVLDTTAGSTPGVPSGVWRPADGTGPTLVAAHPLPPLPLIVDEWSAGIDWVARQCVGADVILAGDLNATLDHLSGLGVGDGTVGECRDAAQDAGSAARGTWPVRLPPALAAPIDHVLVGSAWSVRGFEVRTDFDDAGSDHRPVVAVLARR